MFCQPAFADPLLSIGVQSDGDKAATRLQWAATADYLSKAIPAYRFAITPLDINEFQSAVETHSVAMVLTNPGLLVQLQERYSLRGLATLQSRSAAGPVNRLGAAVFTLRKREDIGHIQDLRNKVLAAGLRESFEDFQIAEALLQNSSVDPHRDLKKLLFYDRQQEAVLNTVLQRTADAGVLPSGSLEKLHESAADLDARLKIIDPGQDLDFPYRYSGSLYPNWTLASGPQLPSDRQAQIRSLLLALGPDSEAAVAGNYHGWTKPADQAAVEDVLKNLYLGPYTNSEADWAWNRWLLLVLMAAAVLIVIRTLRSQAQTSASIAVPFALLVMIGTASVTIILVEQWLNYFQQSQVKLAKASVDGAAENISQFIRQQRRTVQALIDHERSLLLELADFEADPDANRQLADAVANRLPGNFTYMLTDPGGRPLLNSKLNKLGERCQIGIQHFSDHHESHFYPVMLHGNNISTYHFDIMSRVMDSPTAPVFFVSFRPDSIVRLLENAQPPGHSLLLLHKHWPQDIELSSSGARNSDVFGSQLIPTQLGDALYRRTVDGSAWNMVALSNPGWLENRAQFLWNAAISVDLLIFMVTGLFLRRLRHEERRRQQIQGALKTAHHELEQKVRDRTRDLHEQKELAQITLASIGDGVITTDVDGQVTSMNLVAEKLTGWRTADALLRPVEEIFSALDENSREAMKNPVTACLSEGATRQLPQNAVIMHRSGIDIPVQDSAAPIRDSDHHIVGAILVFHDVSESRSYARQIEHQASHDALTGLINRAEFEKRLSMASRSAIDYDNHHALLLLDLDRFKPVNDSCGHAAGDDLLRQVARLMLEKLRQRDTLARIGGDEFAILLDHCPLNVALRIANDLCAAVSNFRFFWEGHAFQIGVSIGLLPIDNQSGAISEIVRKADSACYAAKEHGRGRVHLYTEQDGLKTGDSKWVARITEAFDEQRMQLFKQPIAAIQGQDAPADCIEIQIGMIDRNGEIVLPDTFMPTAERFGMLAKVDQWAVQHTLEWLVENPRILADLAVCWINLSKQTLHDHNFATELSDLLLRYPIAPEKVGFFITESAAISDHHKATVFINAVKARGCRIGLDEFGNGYGSFKNLRHVPVEFLKIDGTCLASAQSIELDIAMVRSIRDIGSMMGIATIASHVEDQKTVALLRKLGVQFVQGSATGEMRVIHLAKTEFRQTRNAR